MDSIERTVTTDITSEPNMTTAESHPGSSHGQQRFDAILRMAHLVESEGDDLKRVEEVLELINASLGASFVTLYELNSDKEKLIPVVTTAEKYRDDILSVPLNLEDSVVGEVVRSRLCRLVNNADKGNRLTIPGLPEGPAAQMAAPLYGGGEVIGVILVVAVGASVLQTEDQGLLTIFAGQTASFLAAVHLNRDLEEAKENLREQFLRAEKMRAIGEIASGVFHDFNNILGAIVGRVQLVQCKTEDEELLKSLNQIERIALQGAETVKRLQEFTRLQHEKTSGPTDLDQVIADALEVTRHRWESQAQKRGLSYTIERKIEEGTFVHARHSQLVDVIANLILNAVDAMDKGGMVTFDASCSGGKCLLKVRDTGAGMSEAEVTKVFTPFYTTKGKEGTGLGLTVVRDVVVDHGGTISVESEVGVGTTFLIELPLHGDTEAPVAADEPEKDPEGLRLLVVDDDSIILDVVAEALEDAGHRVDSFSHGTEAIAAIGKKSYDLIVTDLGMPDVTGWDVARAAKMHQPRLPVVVISGWGAQFSEEQLTDSGVDAMLAKPFHLQTLRETIERLAAGEGAGVPSVTR